MQTMIAGLEPSAPESLPFAPSQEIRAFRLRRDAGDLLIYSVAGLDDAEGVTRHYLNHGHEAMFASRAIDVPVFCHAEERAAVEGAYHVRGTFSRRHTVDGDFEVIPTPGHTPGATAYLWDNGEHRFLFTGDTISLKDGEWVAAVLDSSDRDTYLESLELIAGLDFDVLVPWAASAGRPYYAMTSRDDARRRIDAISERVRGH